MVDSIILAVVVVLMAFAVKASVKHFSGKGSCCSSSPSSPVPEKKLSGAVLHKTLYVDGMKCAHCEDRVHRALDGISALAVTSADWRSGRVTVDLEHDVPQDLIARVVSDCGYSLRKIEDC